MRYLLDTHVFLWYLDRHSPLSRRHRDHLDDLQHELLLSVVSIWELTIKRASGKLNFTGSFTTATQSCDVRVLPIQLRHAEEIEHLPRLHRDPFDHMLIAQARVEGLILVTHDHTLSQYEVPILRV